MLPEHDSWRLALLRQVMVLLCVLRLLASVLLLLFAIGEPATYAPLPMLTWSGFPLLVAMFEIGRLLRGRTYGLYCVAAALVPFVNLILIGYLFVTSGRELAGRGFVTPWFLLGRMRRVGA